MIEKDLCFVFVTRELLIILNLLLIFIMKRNAKFQLNVTENKNIIFLTKFILHMDPTLRNPITNLFFVFFFKVCISNYYLLTFMLWAPMIILRAFKVD